MLQPRSPKERAVAAELAREDFYFFARWMFAERRGYAWQRARHHRLIADALMRVYRGELARLIINIPPRYSKTELAVVNWVAWCLGRAPDSEFIHTSYSAALAAKNSGAALELLQHEAYREIFPGTAVDSTAQAHWTTTAGGVMYAAGAGGTITGFGAGKHRDGFGGAIIIDDPHKPDEARSDTVREGVLEWFQNTLESRRNSPATPIIVIMQRLHERDLAGWLLDGGNGEQWEHLCLPALQDDGSALWPEKHDAETLRRMQAAAPYTFSGQYQQRPSPAEGNVFRPDAMPIVDAIPAGTRFVRGWDFAGTEEGKASDPDWTAGAKLGKTPDGRYVIADMRRFRGAPHDVESGVHNAAKADGNAVTVRIPQDPGQAGKAQVQYFAKRLDGFTVHSKPISGDKVTRAEPFASQVNVGNVMMLRGEWNDALVSEMRMFPNGAHDDQVDALSDAFDEFTSSQTGIIDYYRQQVEAKRAREAAAKQAAGA